MTSIYYLRRTAVQIPTPLKIAATAIPVAHPDVWPESVLLVGCVLAGGARVDDVSLGCAGAGAGCALVGAGCVLVVGVVLLD